MATRAAITYEQAWSTISDIAKACREFNELQFKYRQLAMSLVLAAYAAIGYFLTTPDPAIKAQEEARAAQRTQAQAAAPVATPPTTGEAAAPPKQTGAAAAPEPAPSPSHVRRVSGMLLGIGMLASLATFLIWLIDTRLYHRLLDATFEAGLELEETMTAHGAPPRLHHHMATDVALTGPVFWVSMFYLIAGLAVVVPWLLYVYYNKDVPAVGLLNNLDFAVKVIAGWIAFCLVLVAYVGTPYLKEYFKRRAKLKKRDAGAKALARSQPITPAGGASLSEAIHAARAARANAYAPESGFAVGAGVLAEKGDERKVFGGCNVENAAYGSTMCAERNALAAARAAGFDEVTDIVVYTDAAKLTTPCGACRQVMQELAPRARVHLVSASGECRDMAVSDLFPEPFDRESLARA